MNLGEELHRLADLHASGGLNDDELHCAKERLLNGPAQTPGSVSGHAQAAINALRRSRSNRWLGGVCGGIAEVTGVATWFWRLLFVLLATCAGTGMLLYLLAWVLLPQAHEPVLPAQT